MFYKKINLSYAGQKRTSLGLLSAVFACSVLMFASLFNAGLASAACANTPDPNQGTDTQTINVTTAGTYSIWTRMQAADSTNNSYYLQIDGGCAIDVGDSSSISSSGWTWVNYQNGSTSSLITANLTAGNHTIVMTGREPGVGVDKLLFLSDPTCTPVDDPNTPANDGSNCTTGQAPPTVSITSPASGATVSGTSVPLSANASDGSSGTTGLSVAFAIDGTTVGTDTTSPYSVNWDSTKVSTGTHTLTAKATDSAGLTTTAQETITVAAAQRPPTVSISAPAGNATVSGTTSVTATASSGTSSVQFKLDGANLGSAATSSPFTTSWDTTQATNGTHTLSAVATNSAGSTTSSTVTVTVNNQTAPPKPTISISAPANNASVSRVTTISAAATNATSVQFKLDGNNLGSADTASPYSYSWDTSTAANGTHTLSAVATNSAGSTTSSTVTVTVNNQAAIPAPTISISSPANNATVSGTTSITATTSNATSVQFKLDGNNLGSADTASPYSYSWDTSQVANGTHTLTAVASNTGTTTTTATNVTVTVSNAATPPPPTSVQNLSWNATTKTLSWSAYPGASSYVVAQVHNPTTTRNTDYSWPHVRGTSCLPASSNCGFSAPAAGETVHYGILPLDASGNAVAGSNWANEISVTWPSAPTADTTPPSQPTGLSATAASSSQINLSWTASADNVGVTGYKIYRSTGGGNASLVGTSTTTSYGDTGLNAGTNYVYYVKAVDAAQNLSAASASANATTPASATTITVQGTVTDSTTHNPIANAYVYTDSRATISGGAAAASTDANGNYTLSDIKPGIKHNYYYTAAGYQSQHFYISLPPGLNVENISLVP